MSSCAGHTVLSIIANLPATLHVATTWGQGEARARWAACEAHLETRRHCRLLAWDERRPPRTLGNSGNGRLGEQDMAGGREKSGQAHREHVADGCTDDTRRWVLQGRVDECRGGPKAHRRRRGRRRRRRGAGRRRRRGRRAGRRGPGAGRRWRLVGGRPALQMACSDSKA